MTTHHYLSHSLHETAQIAATLACTLKAGDVVSLTGDLGSGKTTFIQGLAQELGVGANVPVNSPTYTLINIYMGRLPIYHFDWYRLDSAEQLAEVGFTDYIYGDGVCLIEWGDKFPEHLPESTIQVRMRIVSETERAIEII